MSSSSFITITETAGAPAVGVVWRWNGSAVAAGEISLLDYVEEHGERLRQKYLAWIHDLGESVIDGRRVVEHLAVGDGPSFWWLTLLAEKNPWKSPSIVDAIRLFAVEELLLQHRPARVEFTGRGKALHEAFTVLCGELGIGYQWRPLARGPVRFDARAAWHALPTVWRSLAMMMRLAWAAWPFRRLEPPPWQRGPRAVFFCSYFTHLDRAEFEKGRFYSHQWGDLPRMLAEMGRPVNWVHHFHRSTLVPNASSAVRWVRRFNLRPEEEGAHGVLESHMSLGVSWRVFGRWRALRRAGRRLRGIERAFRPAGSCVTLWPLLRRDWTESLGGPMAIVNLHAVELWTRALRELPRQSLGIYLFENQGWECAFVRAWRACGHGRLLAVAHSTIRFWDLRYFTDPRTMRATGQQAAPQADWRVVNADHVLEAQVATGFPREHIRACEALRYVYLSRLAPRADAGPRRRPLRVLVLGDFIAANTQRMLRLLEPAAALLGTEAIYIAKPHPNCAIAVADYPSLGLTIVTQPLEQLLGDFDVAYASNMTSASVDAYVAGLPVAIMLDHTELNFSPLRGQPDARFVGTPEALAVALRQPATSVATARREFFHLGPDLPRWRATIDSIPWEN